WSEGQSEVHSECRRAKGHSAFGEAQRTDVRAEDRRRQSSCCFRAANHFGKVSGETLAECARPRAQQRPRQGAARNTAGPLNCWSLLRPRTGALRYLSLLPILL